MNEENQASASKSLVEVLAELLEKAKRGEIAALEYVVHKEKS